MKHYLFVKKTTANADKKVLQYLPQQVPKAHRNLFSTQAINGDGTNHESSFLITKKL